MTHRGPFQPRTFCDFVITALPQASNWIQLFVSLVFLDISDAKYLCNHYLIQSAPNMIFTRKSHPLKEKLEDFFVMCEPH